MNDLGDWDENVRGLTILMPQTSQSEIEQIAESMVRGTSLYIKAVDSYSKTKESERAVIDRFLCVAQTEIDTPIEFAFLGKFKQLTQILFFMGMEYAKQH